MTFTELRIPSPLALETGASRSAPDPAPRAPDHPGATVLGLRGGESATLLQIAMTGKLPYTALRDGVLSHPKLAEALNNLFTAMDQAG